VLVLLVEAFVLADFFLERLLGTVAAAASALGRRRLPSREGGDVECALAFPFDAAACSLLRSVGIFEYYFSGSAVLLIRRHYYLHETNVSCPSLANSMDHTFDST
jgi:hypothetical protein